MADSFEASIAGRQLPGFSGDIFSLFSLSQHFFDLSLIRLSYEAKHESNSDHEFVRYLLGSVPPRLLNLLFFSLTLSL